MLDINPDFVRLLILKVRQFQVKEEIDDQQEASNPSDDMNYSVLTDNAEDAIYQELKIAITDLDPDQQAELVALMWLGREDYSPQQWQEAVADARKNVGQDAAKYLLAKPQLAEYLAEGLDKLGYGE